MKNIIKFLLFNILLLAPCAAEAMGSLRTFGARTFKTAFTTATKFKATTQAFKTTNKTLLKPFNFKDSNEGENRGSYKTYRHKQSAVLMPLMSAYFIYDTYNRLKISFGYTPSLNNENIKNYPQYKDVYAQQLLEKLLSLNQGEAFALMTLLVTYPEQRQLFIEKIYSLLAENAGNLKKLSKSLALHVIYFEISPVQRKAFKNILLNYVDKELHNDASKFFKAIMEKELPVWCCPEEWEQLQTINHLIHTDHLMWMMSSWTPEHVVHQFEKVKTFPNIFKELFEAEQREHAKGNYVFYHGQQWERHYDADIYKQLWNIQHNQSIQDDFTFFRFNQQHEAPDLRKDSLFLNHSIFGNTLNPGSCSTYYFLNNFNIYKTNMFRSQGILQQCNMAHYYEKYKNDFMKLEQMHKDASKTYGNFMLLSIPGDKLHYVKPAESITGKTVVLPVTIGTQTTTDTKTIIDALIKNPQDIIGLDPLIYVLPLTTEFALDPKKGLHVYSFNAADPKKLKEYEQARDTLFEKIKKDFEQDQSAGKA